MAVDKLVDGTQLDLDLTNIANAIRAKGETSANLSFPSGFISAIQSIPTGVQNITIKTVTVDSDKTSVFNLLSNDDYIIDNASKSGFFAFMFCASNITDNNSVICALTSNIKIAINSYGFSIRTNSSSMAVVNNTHVATDAAYNGNMYCENGSLKVYATSTRILKAGTYVVIMGEV